MENISYHRNPLTLDSHPEFDLYFILRRISRIRGKQSFPVCQKSFGFLSIPEKNNSVLNALHYCTELFFSQYIINQTNEKAISAKFLQKLYENQIFSKFQSKIETDKNTSDIQSFALKSLL